ncbi:MAG: DUF2442 domain-containing protein [Acidobacteria bacterium]|nr:DUF2442 domain-containing protein [Acidobacteriota bacterium]
MFRVLEVRYVAGYTLWLRFSYGTAGEIDLSSELWGPVFEPLRDVEQFKRVQVNPELHTISWPNGADLAPEFLHSQVRVHA